MRMRLIHRVAQMVTLSQKWSHCDKNGHPNNEERMQNLCRTDGKKMILFIFPLLIKRLAEKTKSWHGTCYYIGMDRRFNQRTLALTGSDSSLQKGISRLTLSQNGVVVAPLSKECHATNLYLTVLPTRHTQGAPTNKAHSLETVSTFFNLTSNGGR